MENNVLLGGIGFEMGKPIPDTDEYLSDINNMKLIIDTIVYACKDFMSGNELVMLNNALNEVLCKYEIISDDITKKYDNYDESNKDLLEKYMRAIAIEGKSERTLKYYRDTFEFFLKWTSKPIQEVTSQDIREYLFFRDETGKVSNVTLDNIRRVLSTIFTWFHDERYILKNPTSSIKKIKGVKKVKEPLSPYQIELIRMELSKNNNIRDSAIFELLLSSGIRVGELVQLNINDINFDTHSFIVFGKGAKERECYFNAKTQLMLELYLKERNDDNPALFVSYKTPNKRLGMNGIERRMRELGRRVDVKVHPHLLRKTFATTLLRKDVPIEQVQKLLGHTKIETTTIYAQVDDRKMMNSHKKLLN